MIHEPDVALTDYVLTIEAAAFAILLFRHPVPTAARRVAALIFACVAASSFTGGSYHGFFPGKTATPGGWTIWIATMLLLGVAAALIWVFFVLLCGARAWRRILPPVVAAFAAYAFVVIRVDHGFRVSAIFSAPPILAVLGLMIVRGVRDHSPNAALAAGAILLMLLAAILQQLQIGVSPVWFNHNALYHLLEATALAVLFVALRKAPASAI